jgi:peptidoglycan hydrolase-like protein with peptidoglycan-binding domain
VSRVAATKSAKPAAWTSASWLGCAALALLVAAAPAEASQKQKKAPDPEPAADIDNSEPMMLVVSVAAQKVDIYRGTSLLTTSSVSTGTAEHPTMIGAFSIIEKQRWHHSNIYSGAPMPWMNRITWSGTALHAGVVPGYPASHGCIRLTYDFAPKLFQMTTVGDNVIVSRSRPKPSLIEHPNLFQPAPPQEAAAEVHIAEARPDSPSLPEMATAASPVILAKAESSMTVDSEGQSPAEPAKSHSLMEPPAPSSVQHALPDNDADPYRAHAITPDEDGGGETHATQDPTAGAAGTAPEKQTASTPASPAPEASKTPEASATTPTPVSPAPPVAVTATAPASPPASAPLAAAKIDAGIAAAAMQAAEPRSEAPLRILLTRRTQRDRIIGVQQILAEAGYLSAQDFDGTMGKATIIAIKAFQKANGMPETGAFTDELVKKVYAVAGKGEPPAGHLYVRQSLARVFDTPVSFRDPDQPLGTHVYTALKFAKGDSKARWMTVDVQVGDGTSPLDRIEIPDDVRQKVSERLTPGSTFIIADTSINSANLPRGGDFVVLAKSTGAAKISQAGDDAPAEKKPRHRSNTVAKRYNSGPFGGGSWYARPW